MEQHLVGPEYAFATRQYLYPPEFHHGFFRFSVGIEDAADIIGDLRQAMEKAGLGSAV